MGVLCRVTRPGAHVREAEFLQERADAVPNVIPVVLTTFGMIVAQMVPNAFIIEPIFSWQGLGAYFVEAARFRDLPVLQACLLIFSVLFIVANLAVDLIVIVVDPLQRRAAGA